MTTWDARLASLRLRAAGLHVCRMAREPFPPGYVEWCAECGRHGEPVNVRDDDLLLENFLGWLEKKRNGPTPIKPCQ